MKLLFFIESLNAGGKERRLVELIKGLSLRSDIEMELVLTDKEIHYQEIHSCNIKIHYTIRGKFKKDPKLFFQFYKIARNFMPDIIHVWGNLVAVYAIPTKLILKIPMINNQITDAPLQISNSLFSSRLTFPFSDLIVANSYAGLKSYKAPANKSEVIYNGFDFKRLEKLTEKSKIKNHFSIKTRFVTGMVASFSYKKDYETYIKAANIVLSTNRDITFLCIGGGDYVSYEKLVKTENRNNVLFLGKQVSVESIMNLCDIGVLMTNVKVHGEGISNALLEFASLRKPIIANHCGGNAELIEDGVNGYLIEQKSPKLLADKILKILNNRNLKVDFGNNSKKKVIAKFGISRMIDEFILAYKKLKK